MPKVGGKGNSMEWLSLTKDQFKNMQIEATSCSAYCNKFSSCGDCIYGTGQGNSCGWCKAENKCVGFDENAQCSDNKLWWIATG